MVYDRLMRLGYGEAPEPGHKRRGCDECGPCDAPLRIRIRESPGDESGTPGFTGPGITPFRKSEGRYRPRDPHLLVPHAAARTPELHACPFGRHGGAAAAVHNNVRRGG